MKLLVMSDTHGDAEVIKRVRERHNDVDFFIHCGDSELSYDHDFLSDMKRVRGNCDRDTHFPDELSFKVSGKKIFVTHGHLFNVKSTTINLFYRAKELEADVVFFGHSHVLGCELVDNVLFVNPGSLLKPRGIEDKSYTIVELVDETWVVTGLTSEGIEIFSKQFIIK